MYDIPHKHWFGDLQAITKTKFSPFLTKMYDFLFIFLPANYKINYYLLFNRTAYEHLKCIHLLPSERCLKGRNPNMWHQHTRGNVQRDKDKNKPPRLLAACLFVTHHISNRNLTQFFLFFFLFFASASMLEPTLEWLVALVMLLTLSEECCLLMRRSGCWFCCWCCWLPLLPAEERHVDVCHTLVFH